MSDGVRLIGVCLMGCPGGGLSDAVLLMGCPGGGAGSPFLLSSRKRVEEGLKVWGEKMPTMGRGQTGNLTTVGSHHMQRYFKL